MAKKPYTPKQIIIKLREAEILLNQGTIPYLQCGRKSKLQTALTAAGAESTAV